MRLYPIILISAGVLLSSCSIIFDSESNGALESDRGLSDARGSADASALVDASSADRALADAMVEDASPPEDRTIAIRITDTNDDIEQVVSSGSIRNVSADLDFDANSIVGLRFPSVSIPQGSTIVDARIRFTAQVTGSGDTTLEFRADPRASPPPFSLETNHLSSRPTSAESVVWSPSTWNISMNYYSPSLISLVRPLVNQQTWNQGNSMVFMITTLSGDRNALSFDATLENSADVAILVITYR